MVTVFIEIYPIYTSKAVRENQMRSKIEATIVAMPPQVVLNAPSFLYFSMTGNENLSCPLRKDLNLDSFID